MCLDANNSWIIVAAMAALYFTCLANAGARSPALLAFTIFPALDILTDTLYLVQTTFFSPILAYFVAFFIIAPNIVFSIKLYNIGALKPQFLIPLPTQRFLWLGVDKGFPTAYGARLGISFERHDTLLKLISYWISWALVIALQLACLAVFSMIALPALAVHLPFYIVWLFIGFFLHQTKSLAIGKIWTLWFRVWTGTNKYELTALVDTGFMNESLFAEFVFETLPQLVIQTTNNQLINSWGAIGIFSTVLSIFMAFNGVYRFVYWTWFLGVKFEDVPIELYLGPWFTLQIPKSDFSTVEYFERDRALENNEEKYRDQNNVSLVVDSERDPDVEEDGRYRRADVEDGHEDGGDGDGEGIEMTALFGIDGGSFVGDGGGEVLGSAVDFVPPSYSIQGKNQTTTKMTTKTKKQLVGVGVERQQQEQDVASIRQQMAEMQQQHKQQMQAMENEIRHNKDEAIQMQQVMDDRQEKMKQGMDEMQRQLSELRQWRLAFLVEKDYM